MGTKSTLIRRRNCPCTVATATTRRGGTAMPLVYHATIQTADAVAGQNDAAAASVYRRCGAAWRGMDRTERSCRRRRRLVVPAAIVALTTDSAPLPPPCNALLRTVSAGLSSQSLHWLDWLHAVPSELSSALHLVIERQTSPYRIASLIFACTVPAQEKAPLCSSRKQTAVSKWVAIYIAPKISQDNQGAYRSYAQT